jgi:hypothetical protein
MSWEFCVGEALSTPFFSARKKGVDGALLDLSR